MAALVLTVFLAARGIGWLLSPWNPHVGMLPFGVVLLTSARLATGDGRALPLAALAASVVVQCHIIWALPTGLAVGAGLLLCVSPAARARLGIPALGRGLSVRPVALAVLVSGLLWALPVVDELTGEYRNLHRIVGLLKEPRPPRPWADSLAPAARAFNLLRDGAVSFSWGARNPDLEALPSQETPKRELLWAVGTLVALAAAGRASARRRCATAALAVIAATGFVAAPLVARLSPGKVLSAYLLQWASMVTLLALVVVGVEIVARSPRVRALVLGRAGKAALAAIPVVLLGSGLVQQASDPASPRDARAGEVERLTAAIRERARADLGERRFLLRVAPHVDQATAVGLVLALDKAGLRFGVEPFGSCRIEGRFTPRGDEWAELLVGDLPAIAGAVRLGPPDGLSVVWQQPWKAVGPGAVGR